MIARQHDAPDCAGRNGAHTPGPWDYVPSNEYHGPYVTTEYGSTVCDCYCMSNPLSLSVRNGGDSKPIHHMHEMADANARLIAAAPELLEALKLVASSGKFTCFDDAGWDAVNDAIAKTEGRS